MPMLTTRAFCRTHLGQVHYVDSGPRDGAPVVLMHQTPRSVDEFAEVAALLAASHRVIAIDTPGYGCSDHPATQPSVADYARAVVEVMDAAGCPRACLAGHHTGAILAIEIAAAQPARVTGLSLSGPVYLDEAGRRELSRHFGQWHVQADGSHLQEKWDRFSRWVASAHLTHRLLVDLLVAGETSEFGHFAVAEYRMEDRLPLVACPGLLILGRRDPFTSRDQLGPFRAVLRPVREVELDGGVFLPNEAPEAYAEAIRAFAR
jgi:pimeloyl-ACP methyl ester carboxylesterase